MFVSASAGCHCQDVIYWFSLSNNVMNNFNCQNGFHFLSCQITCMNSNCQTVSVIFMSRLLSYFDLSNNIVYEYVLSDCQ